MLNRAAASRPARPLSAGARGRSAAVAGANRAAALAAGSREAANARERALFLGSASPEAPGAPGAQAPSAAAARARRRSAAARLGSKSLAVLMAVILAVGLMPLPAFGDGGVVVNGQRVVAAAASSLTTVDADGNVTTESSEATLSGDGTVTVDGRRVPALDSTAESLALYRLQRLTAGSATIADLKGYSSASGLSPAAGIAAAAQRAEDEALAAFDSEDAAIDAQVAADAGLAAQLEALDFSTQRIVVALSEGASLQERDLNNVVSEGDGLYVLQYKNRDAAKRAYIRYTQYEGALFAAPDVQVDASAEDSDGPDSDDEDASDPDGAVTPALQASGSTQGQLSEEADRRESEEATKAAPERAAVIALIDTAVAADLVEKWNGENGASASVTRVSVLSDDGSQPDAKSTDEGYQETHGDKMLKAILAANPDARVVSIEALDETGRGSASSVYDALRQAAAAKAAVINMSFAGYAVAGNGAIGAGVQEAIDSAKADGREIALLAAAGNQDQDAKYFVPASYDGVTAVGALDPAKLAGAAADDILADPQSYKQATSNHGETVALWAPGESTSFATATAAGTLSDLFNTLAPANRMQALQSVLLAAAPADRATDQETPNQDAPEAAGQPTEQSLVVFQANDDKATGSMEPLEATNGTFTAPESGFQLEGKYFSGWTVASPDAAGAASTPEATAPALTLLAGTQVKNWHFTSADGEELDLSPYVTPGTGDATTLTLQALWSDTALGGIADAIEANAAAASTALEDLCARIFARGAAAGVWSAAVESNAVDFLSRTTAGAATGKATFDEGGLVLNLPYLGSNTYSSGNNITNGDGYKITLPAGKYKLEAWGGSGGDARSSRSTYASLTPSPGGIGGYSAGVVELTDATTLYVYVGGKGQSDVETTGTGLDPAWGGYNGGGNPDEVTSGDQSYDYALGAGGGATHFASASGLLKDLVNDKGKVVLVAGGGGGAGMMRGQTMYTRGGLGGGETGNVHTRITGGGTEAYESLYGYPTQDGYEGTTTTTPSAWADGFATKGNSGAQGGFGFGAQNGGGGWYGGGGKHYHANGNAGGSGRVGGLSATYNGTSATGTATIGGKTVNITDGVSTKAFNIALKSASGGTLEDALTWSSAYEPNPLAVKTDKPGDYARTHGYARITMLAPTITYHDWSGKVIGTQSFGSNRDDMGLFTVGLTRPSSLPGLTETATVSGSTVTFAGWTTYASNPAATEYLIDFDDDSGNRQIASTKSLNLYPAYFDNSVNFGDHSSGDGISTITFSKSELGVEGVADAGTVLGMGYNGTSTYAAGNNVNNGYGYDVTLPMAKYTLKAWGASGGDAEHSSTDHAKYVGIGGIGGYSEGTLTLVDDNTDIYTYVGGMGQRGASGSSIVLRGGFNGGSDTTAYTSPKYAWGGGGGATHFAAAPGLLQRLVDDKQQVILVAGGGGGAGSMGSMYTRGGLGGGENSTIHIMISHGTGTGDAAAGKNYVSRGYATQTSSSNLNGGYYGRNVGGTSIGGFGYGTPNGSGGGWYGGSGIHQHANGSSGGSGRVGGLNGGTFNNYESSGQAVINGRIVDIVGKSTVPFIQTLNNMTDENAGFMETKREWSPAFEANPVAGDKTNNPGEYPRTNGYAQIVLDNYIVVYHDWDGNELGVSDFGTEKDANGLYEAPLTSPASFKDAGLTRTHTVEGIGVVEFAGWTTDPDSSFGPDFAMQYNDATGDSVARRAKSINVYPAYGNTVIYHDRSGKRQAVTTYQDSTLILSEADARAMGNKTPLTEADTTLGEVFIGWSESQDGPVAYHPGEKIDTQDVTFLYPVYSTGTAVAGNIPVAEDPNLTYTVTRKGDNSGATSAGADARPHRGAREPGAWCKVGASRRARPGGRPGGRGGGPARPRAFPGVLRADRGALPGAAPPGGGPGEPSRAQAALAARARRRPGGGA